jgi:hypothetical protein
VSPQWSNFVLSSDIPYSEANVFVLDSFDVESYARLELCKYSKGVREKG